MRLKFLFSMLLLALLAPMGAFCQDASDNGSGDIRLSVVVPDQVSGLNPGQLERLKNKITNLVTENNFSADGSEDGFVIYPYFQVIDTQRVGESGLRALTQVNCSFSLFIKQVTPGSKSQPVLASVVMDISGGGGNANEAISNAFQLIRPTNTRLQNFFVAAKAKIDTYYAQNCDRIMRAAQAATNTSNYAEAFALLTSIPADAKQCYDALQQKIQDTYLKMQTQDCEKIIIKAKAFIASKAYDSAVAKLQLVDPQSTCRDELLQLINDIGTQVGADGQAQVDQLKTLANSNNKDEISQSRLSNILRLLNKRKEQQPADQYHIQDGTQGQNAVIVADIAPAKTDVNYADL